MLWGPQIHKGLISMFEKMGAFELTLSIPPFGQSSYSFALGQPKFNRPKKEQPLRAAPTMRSMLPGSLNAM